MKKKTANPAERTKKSTPDGHEIMKRKAPKDLGLRPARFEFDPKKAYSTDQLSEIGAISVKWNQIEGHIDFIGSFILFSKTPFWLRIATDRVLTTTRKLELLEECSRNSHLLDDLSKQCIEEAFYQFRTYRTYRNAIIHHNIYDHEKGIGSYVDERSNSSQILVSLDALRRFYDILCVFLEELREIDLLFRIETDAQRPGKLDTATQKFTPFNDDELRTKIIPDQTKRVIALQKKRKNLPKLPKFPDAELIRTLNEPINSDSD